jgi:hypothetical protein
MKSTVIVLLALLMVSCGKTGDNNRTTSEQKPRELGEYLYLEYEEGAICHTDKNCGKNCTYIKTDIVLSSVREAKRKGDYIRGNKGHVDAIYGNFHFCSKCIPLSMMKEIDTKTD